VSMMPQAQRLVDVASKSAKRRNGMPDFALLPGAFHGDPVDRVIAATAIAHELTLITPDPQIAFRRVCHTMHYKWRASKKQS
jgi:PIN domain nuclease of toxin-antitoxin system